MKSYIQFFIFFLLISSVNAQVYYSGKVSNLDVHCFLLIDEGGVISGDLFYSRFRTPISIKGKIVGNKVSFSEYDDKGQITGSYLGSKYKENDSIAGEWTNSKGKKLNFYFAQSSRLKYLEALNWKDVNSVSDPALKKLLSGFVVKSLPFKITEGEWDKPIDSNLIRKVLNPALDYEGRWTTYHKGYVYFQPDYVGIVIFRSYDPGAFGIHHLFVEFYSVEYDGSIISSEEIGCYCNDTNMGSNDYYSKSEKIEVFESEIKVTSTNIHDVLFEEDLAEGQESEDIYEEEIEHTIYNITKDGLLAEKSE